jgi:hypothetical protein
MAGRDRDHAPEPNKSLAIIVDDPRRTRVAELLKEHLAAMAQHSPPESVHALDKRAGHMLTIFRRVNGGWLLARDAKTDWCKHRVPRRRRRSGNEEERVAE